MSGLLKGEFPLDDTLRANIGNPESSGYEVGLSLKEPKATSRCVAFCSESPEARIGACLQAEMAICRGFVQDVQAHPRTAQWARRAGRKTRRRLLPCLCLGDGTLLTGTLLTRPPKDPATRKRNWEKD